MRLGVQSRCFAWSGPTASSLVLGKTVGELANMLGGFHPPQGYTLVDKHPALAGVCDKLISADVVRELVIDHPTSVT
jgi:hypothetical protein